MNSGRPQDIINDCFILSLSLMSLLKKNHRIANHLLPTQMAKNGQRPKTIWQSRTMPRNPSGQHLRHRWSKGCASVGVNEHLRGVVNEHLHDGVVNVHLHSVSVNGHIVHDVDVNEHLHACKRTA